MRTAILDSSVLIGVDRNDRATMALLQVARTAGFSLRTNPNIIAQVWRDADGRQALLARFLRTVECVELDAVIGRRCGEILARARTTDVVDASVVAISLNGDRIFTGDTDDIATLVSAANLRVEIVRC